MLLFLSAINVNLFLGREYTFFIELDSNKLMSETPFNFIFKIISLDLAILLNLLSSNFLSCISLKSF